MHVKLDIRKYQSVTAFLGHYYEQQKSADSEFSYAAWARALGLKNRTYLSLILTGARPISERLTQSFIAYFQFDVAETEYFVNLLGYNQSRHQEHRRIFGQQVLKFQTLAEDFQEVQSHYEFLSNPLLPRVQTLLSFEDFTPYPAEAARILGVSEAEFAGACRELEKLALIERIERPGDPSRWKTKKRSWRLPERFRSLGHRDFYLETLRRAGQAIDLFKEHERKFRSLFVALNPAEFEDFLKDFEVFVQSQLAKRDGSSIRGRRLYQLNFAFFPESQSNEAVTDSIL